MPARSRPAFSGARADSRGSYHRLLTLAVPAGTGHLPELAGPSGSHHRRGYPGERQFPSVRQRSSNVRLHAGDVTLDSPKTLLSARLARYGAGIVATRSTGIGADALIRCPVAELTS